MNIVNSTNGNGLGVKKFIPGIVWFILVLVLLCLPGSDLPKVEDWLNKIYFDKWVHIGLFAVLAFLFMWPFLKSSIDPREKWLFLVKISIAASVWGLTTEFIQRFYIPGRSFDLFDWAADSFGALLALIFSRFRFL